MTGWRASPGPSPWTLLVGSKGLPALGGSRAKPWPCLRSFRLHPGRITERGFAGGDVVGDDAAGADQRAGADGDAGEDDGAGADPDVGADRDRAAEFAA